jgi:triphosphoribosyl-dephospho-CoA synthase
MHSGIDFNTAERALLAELDCSTLAGCLAAACLLEVTARKPGNVHPEASFVDVTYADFVKSARAIAPVLAATEPGGVGEAVYRAVAATQEAVGSNTNLGIILLLAPLAAAANSGAARTIAGLRAAVREVLAGLTVTDSQAVFRAIRLAQPGGLGEADEQDVAHEPTQSLVEIMRLAAGRDRIARQYVTVFAEVFELGVPAWRRWQERGAGWETAVIGLSLNWLQAGPDTLIARKLGTAIAAEASRRAGEVLALGWPTTGDGERELREFDRWLRVDGHRRNPGTTADLVAATLFTACWCEREASWGRTAASVRLA